MVYIIICCLIVTQGLVLHYIATELIKKYITDILKHKN